MTDAQPATPAHPNQLAQLLLTSPAYSWEFRSGKETYASSHQWPRKPEAIKAMKAAFGCEVPDTYAEVRSKGDVDVTGWVRALIENGQETDREGYLRRRGVILTASGMNSSDTPIATMTARWQTWGGGARPPIGTLNVAVEWHADGHAILTAEALANTTGMFDLYVLLGCNHEFVGQSVGRCLTQYTCKNCRRSHQIDSGD